MPQMQADHPRSFEEFWPFYLGEHRRPLTRTLHFAGTSTVVLVALAALVQKRPALLSLLPFVGYGPAWFAHFFVERNRPATFKYPLWSLMADFRMWGEMLCGRRWNDEA